VLHATGDGEVVGAECDRARHRGDGRHGAGAHPIQRVAGNRDRQTGEDRGGATEGESLVALLSGRGDGDVVDALLGDVRVALQETDHRLDDQVVSARSPVLTLFAGSSEGSANSIYKDDFFSVGHDAS